MSENETRLDVPSVYVGTYAKYAAGSIAGKWLNVEDYASHDDFMEACAALHSDESDPEFMFQDYQCFPAGFYAESRIDPDLWGWLDLDENDREILEVYQAHVDQNGTFEEVRDAFMGNGYNTEADWAAEYWEESGLLDQIPESLRHYIDYESYARDARCGGDVTFARHNGSVWAFSNS